MYIVLPQNPSGNPVSLPLNDILVGLLGVTSAICSIIDQPDEAGGALRNPIGLRIL